MNLLLYPKDLILIYSFVGNEYAVHELRLVVKVSIIVRTSRGGCGCRGLSLCCQQPENCRGCP